ncbi:MAG: PAS domain S-box protein [Bacillota bacterium]|nr:PAS domain S-box protein [Bacillota bacterium]MDW7683235.1 PAS domain S-box protein [Bacillota bacterium]
MGGKTVFEENFADLVLNSVPFPVCVVNDQTKAVKMNHAFKQLPAKESDRIVENLTKQTLGSQGCFDSDITVESGERQVFRWSVTPLYNKGINYIMLSGVEITEHKQAENKLLESKNYLAEIIESNLDFVVRVDMDGRFLYVNDAYCRAFGKTRDELIGQSFLPLVHPEDLDATLREMKKLYDEPYRVYVEQRAKTIHGWRWIAWQDYAIRDETGKVIEVQAVGRDISQLKTAETELKKSRQRLIEAQETALIGNWEWDILRNKIFWSEPVFRIFEMDPVREELTLDFFTKHILPEDSAEVSKQISQSLQTNNYSSEHRIRTRRGNLRWVYNKGKTEYDSFGNPVRMFGVTQDITERKLSEINLKKTMEQYRNLIELMPDAVFILHRREIVFANSAAVNLSGQVEPGCLLGKKLDQLFTKQSLRKLTRAYIHVLKSKSTTCFNNGQIKRSDGKVIDIQWVCIPFTYQSRQVLQLIVRDITIQKKIEEEQTKATKLESLGILAGGIAHDFNNLLTILLGNLSIAKNVINDPERVLHKLSEVEAAAFQTKDLTKQLLTFAKGGAPIKQTASVVDVVRDAAEFALCGSNVNFSFCSEDVPYVDIDSNQIGQVINNLILNAVQAMPGGGTIHIDINTCEVKKSNYVRIAIRDEGLGIPETIIQKIFDPYFTTKETGSGLGLAVCYSIIKKHNGILEVDSKVGEGSTFKISLPISTSDHLHFSSLSRNKTPVDGQGHILVMDDDEAIGKVVCEMLELLGYKSTYVRDGNQAIDVYTKAMQTDEKFVAVILDLTIRGSMGGEETVRKLHAVDPGVKAIVSSGYANNNVLSNYGKYGFSGVVAKPFVLNELGQVLLETIHSKKEHITG